MDSFGRKTRRFFFTRLPEGLRVPGGHRKENLFQRTCSITALMGGFPPDPRGLSAVARSLDFENPQTHHGTLFSSAYYAAAKLGAHPVAVPAVGDGHPARWAFDPVATPRARSGLFRFVTGLLSHPNLLCVRIQLSPIFPGFQPSYTFRWGNPYFGFRARNLGDRAEAAVRGISRAIAFQLWGAGQSKLGRRLTRRRCFLYTCI